MPSLGHRVSAHATPQDTAATVHKYPIGIRNSPRCGAAHASAAGRALIGSAPSTRTRPAFLGDLWVPITW